MDFAIQPVTAISKPAAAGENSVAGVSPKDGGAAFSVPFSDGSGPSGATEVLPVYRKFEAMFIAQLVSAMLETGGDGEGAETQASIQRGWMAQAIGDQIAERGGFGLAESLSAAESARLNQADG